ncbi:MAG TPA: tail protein X [Thermoguttaceae bacterium]|nr:tail protein X [Thermoguttaceae bacterium]HPP51510.1 tail protein X [Thermoguttaceae bacterium]
MESGRRKLLAFSILFGGLGLAWLVRPSADGAWFASGWGGGKLILRKEGSPTGLASAASSPLPLLPSPPGSSPSPAGPIAGALSNRRSALGVGGVSNGTLPSLAPRFPFLQTEALSSDPPRSGQSESQPRRHRIADGDTLENLADRYLGDAALAIEIYQANRSVIPDPHLLPIGVEITIPPRGSVEVIPFHHIRGGKLAPLADAVSGGLASGPIVRSQTP